MLKIINFLILFLFYLQVYSALPLSERQRVEKLEFLDEHELLAQLFQHYCIAIGYKGELLRDVAFA